LMPLRPTPLSVATPEPSVAAVPAAVPFTVKLIVLPLKAEPPEVSVAVRVAVRWNTPEPVTLVIVVGN
jgi:hypothetical protein